MSKSIRASILVLAANVLHWVLYGFSLYPNEWMKQGFLLFIVILAFGNLTLANTVPSWNKGRDKS